MDLDINRKHYNFFLDNFEGGVGGVILPPVHRIHVYSTTIRNYYLEKDFWMLMKR